MRNPAHERFFQYSIEYLLTGFLPFEFERLSGKHEAAGDIKSVNAISKTIIEKRPKSSNSNELATVENEDLIVALAEYENGAVGTPGRGFHHWVLGEEHIYPIKIFSSA